jgi:hypothetical protein
MTRRPTRRDSAGLWALAMLLGACSLPADEGVTPIDPDGLPPELADTTTTSTTTSTTTTVPLPTSEPPQTTAPTTPPAPTTAPPSNAVPVDIYYADRATDGMQSVSRLLLGPVSLQNVMNQLEQPPDDLSSYGLTSALELDLIDPSSSLDRSVLTLSLNSAVFEAMNEDQKRQAIAQMVLTFTSFAVPGEGNIGSVVILVDGAPIPVYIPAEGTTRDPGSPVFYDDFANLVVGTTGATTTTAPPTTAPPTQTSAPPPGPGG